MKTKLVGFLMISIVLVMVGILMTEQTAGAKAIELKYNGLVPPGTTYSDPVDEWGRLVEKETDGKVKYVAYHSQALGKYTDSPKLMKGGLCEMAMVTGATPGFELLGLAESPAHVTSIRIEMDFLNALYRKGLLSSMFEDNGFKLIFFMTSHPRMLLTGKNKPVTKLSELKGLKIRGISPTHVDVAKAMGATAVMISTPDVYMALERGTIDGQLNTITGIFAMKWDALTKHCLWEPVTTDVMAIVMSLKVWNSLSPEVQVVIQRINEEMRYKYLEYYHTEREEKERCSKAGIEVHYLAPEERKTLRELLEPVNQAIVNRLEERGIPAKKVDAEMRRILEQY